MYKCLNLLEAFDSKFIVGIYERLQILQIDSSRDNISWALLVNAVKNNAETFVAHVACIYNKPINSLVRDIPSFRQIRSQGFRFNLIDDLFLQKDDILMKGDEVGQRNFHISSLNESVVLNGMLLLIIMIFFIQRKLLDLLVKLILFYLLVEKIVQINDSTL